MLNGDGDNETATRVKSAKTCGSVGRRRVSVVVKRSCMMLDGPDGGDGQAARIGVELPINTYSGSLYYCSDIIPVANEWTTLGFPHPPYCRSAQFDGILALR